MPLIFPILTVGPDVDSMSIRRSLPAYLESNKELGFRETRKRHTWSQNILTTSYRDMTDQDRLDLQGFYESTTGAGCLEFLWFNPQDFQTHEVKFFGLPLFRHQSHILPERRFNVTIQLIEHGRVHAYEMAGGRLGEGRLGW